VGLFPSSLISLLKSINFEYLDNQAAEKCISNTINVIMEDAQRVAISDSDMVELSRAVNRNRKSKINGKLPGFEDVICI
jgi:hypothetical protein